MNISKSIPPALVAVTAILFCSKTSVTVVSTTRENPWMEVSSPLSTGTGRAETLVIDMDRKEQTIEGRGVFSFREEKTGAGRAICSDKRYIYNRYKFLI